MWSGDYKMALTSLRSARWRSTLTMLGIIIGVSSVVTIASLGEGLKRQIVGQLNQLGTNVVTIRSGKVVSRDSGGKVSSFNPLALLATSTLSDQDVESVRNVPGTRLAVPMSIITNTVFYEGKEFNNAYVVAATPELNQVLSSNLNYGTFYTQDDQDRPVAVIGPGISERVFGELNPVGQSFKINDTTFLVRGIMGGFAGGVLATSGVDLNYAVFIPYNVGKQITGDKAQISQILVGVDDSVPIDQTTNELHHALLANHKGQDNFSILKQDELLSISGSLVNLATGFISGIAAISLLVGGIGIMNIMLVSVSERTREIGIRKALGASNRQIRNQFIIEGTLISIVGGAIGLGLALALNFLLRIYTGFKPVITLGIMAIAVSVSIILGIIFATAPAVKAARKNPIDALRNE